MKLVDPIKMNDWNIKYFIIFVIVMQILLWLSYICDTYLFNTFAVRIVIAFICLMYLNGVLFLRILRIHKISSIQTILYSVGISLAFLMFMGMLIDLVYPVLGIIRPIAFIPLMIMLTLFTVLLCILAYRRDKESFITPRMEIKSLNKTILILMLPVMSIIGIYLINFYQNNIILILMFILIAFIPILVSFDKFFTKDLYPVTIFSVALALLLSTSLFTNYITGWDINTEYYFSNLVVSESYWNFSIPDFLNAMLSLVITVPIFSKISGLNVVGILKIIYPFIFSIVPLGLYWIFSKQTNKKMGFFACTLFIFVFMFFLVMPYLARQEIGELFFVLMIMLMVEEDLRPKVITIFTIIFIPALLVSHYSMDYIYIFLILSSYLIILVRNLNLTEKYPALARWRFIKFFFLWKGPSKETFKINYKLQIILVITVTIIYYILVSSSVLFNTTVFTINNLISTGLNSIFNPGALMAVNIVTTEKTFLRSIALLLHLFVEFLIGIGVLLLILRRVKYKFDENYNIFSVMMFLMLFLVIFVPFLAGALNPDRFYQISLILLSIFFVVGWLEFSEIINKLFKWKISKKNLYKNSLRIMAVFLGISLIFNSGVIYELAGDKPTSMVLHTSMDGPKFNEMEISGAIWISKNQLNNTVYADSYRVLLLNGFSSNELGLKPGGFMNQSSYLFLGTRNIENDTYGLSSLGSNILTYYNSQNITSSKLKIYDDGGSQIYQARNSG